MQTKMKMNENYAVDTIKFSMRVMGPYVPYQICTHRFVHTLSFAGTVAFYILHTHTQKHGSESNKRNGKYIWHLCEFNYV